MSSGMAMTRASSRSAGSTSAIGARAALIADAPSRIHREDSVRRIPGVDGVVHIAVEVGHVVPYVGAEFLHIQSRIATHERIEAPHGVYSAGKRPRSLVQLDRRADVSISIRIHDAGHVRVQMCVPRRRIFR